MSTTSENELLKQWQEIHGDHSEKLDRQFVLGWQARAELANKEREELLAALEKMCEFHEINASWDKGNNGYYAAKALIKNIRGS